MQRQQEREGNGEEIEREGRIDYSGGKKEEEMRDAITFWDGSQGGGIREHQNLRSGASFFGENSILWAKFGVRDSGDHSWPGQNPLEPPFLVFESI